MAAIIPDGGGQEAAAEAAHRDGGGRGGRAGLDRHPQHGRLPQRRHRLVRRSHAVGWDAARGQLPSRALSLPVEALRAKLIAAFAPQKIALYMNSSQVSGKGQLAQSIRLTFKEGLLSPYRVVGPASLIAWFFQYSVMGFAFQFFDTTLSKLFGVNPVYYGPELMTPPPLKLTDEREPASMMVAGVVKTALAPVLSGSLESLVANRAEAERYYGRQQFKQIETHLNWGRLSKILGPAYLANSFRNIIMCSTTFVVTPITYKLYFPQARVAGIDPPSLGKVSLAEDA